MHTFCGQDRTKLKLAITHIIYISFIETKVILIKPILQPKYLINFINHLHKRIRYFIVFSIFLLADAFLLWLRNLTSLIVCLNHHDQFLSLDVDTSGVEGERYT